MTFRTAAVLGTGMMGPGIASTLALGGVEARIVSRTPDGACRGLESARQALAVLAENGLVAPADAAAALARLSSTDRQAEALEDVDLVVESAPENMEFKQALFAALDAQVRSDTVLASNTSGLSITAIASRCSRPERVLTTHFWNPPHLMPLVELVRGEHTAPAVVEAVRELLRGCGKVPVLVKKDRPGQLGNRMQMALVREAVHIVAEGIADPEDVDTAARLGFGIRLPVYGVLEHQDLIGLEMGNAICDYVARDLNNEPCSPQLYRDKIARGETGAAAGRGFHDWAKRSAGQVKARRDRFLIECLKLGVSRDF